MSVVKTTSETLRYGRRAAALAVLVSTLLSVLLGEVVLRPFSALDPRPRAEVGEFEFVPNDFLVPDDRIGWKMKSTAHGFRGQMEFHEPDSSRRIILVGDSFTWGSGVEYEDTFAAKLDARLSDTVVYNMALPGFGVDQIWLIGRYEALPREPDLIVAGICDCDFSRSLTAYRSFEQMTKPVFRLEDGQLVPKTPADRTSPIRRYLEHRSRLWTGFRQFQHWVVYRTRFLGHTFTLRGMA